MPGPTDPPDWMKENKGRAENAFDRARGLRQLEAQKAPERVESHQVRQSAPTMQPRPPTQVRQAVDRGAHNERTRQDQKAADVARARQLKEAVVHRQNEAQKTRDKDKER